MVDWVNRSCAALGRGLIAGPAGTAAMTLSSTVEAKISGREPSTAPADAVAVVARVQPKDQVGQARLNTAAHCGYGTGWGVARAVLDLLGLRGPVATAAHFGAVLGAEQALLPALGVAKPTPAYGAAAAVADALHHALPSTPAPAGSLTTTWPVTNAARQAR